MGCRRIIHLKILVLLIGVASGASAGTDPIPPRNRAEQTVPLDAQLSFDALFSMRMGLFIHWIGPPPGTNGGIRLSDGSYPKSIDDFADRIDVKKVVENIAALHFEYVVLTDFHGGGTTLHPCAPLERWRGKGYSARRDVAGEMIRSLKEKGIRVILFTHPLDGHDFTPDQQRRLGWSDPVGGYRRWNDFINDVYDDLARRYGSSIAAIGMDSEFGLSGNPTWTGKLDLLRLRNTILKRAPALRLMALAGPNDTCEFGLKEIWRPSWFDPWMSRAETDYNPDTWPAYRRAVAVVQGFHWATVNAPAEGMARLTGAQMFRYTVLQAATATEGPGVVWAASPYTDGTWERGVHEAFVDLAGKISGASEAVRDVYPSTAYPTSEGATIASLPWGGVATRSRDGRLEYLHVLNHPQTATLNLPSPSDASRFSSATLLASGHSVRLSQTSNGVELTLEDPDSWDDNDTVIKLERKPASRTLQNLAWHKPVFASSSIEMGATLNDHSDFGRIRLVDGVCRPVPKPAAWSSGNAGWSSAYRPADHPEWVGVDLMAAIPVSEVRLYPRNDRVRGEGFPHEIKVQISADEENWETVCSRSFASPPQDQEVFSFPARRARFVRVMGLQLRSNCPDRPGFGMQLIELEVFGRAD